MAAQGFGEKRQADYAAGVAPVSISYTNLKIDSAGRIIVPAEMRAAMLAKAGDTLTARVVDGELRVVSRAWVMRRIAEEAERSRAAYPGDAVDELLADRREEARLEDERWARLEREGAGPPDGSAGR